MIIKEKNEETQSKDFLRIYTLLIEDRARKCSHHDIHLFYDKNNRKLIIQMTNEHGIIYYNEFKSSIIFASHLEDEICHDFIANHRITLSSQSINKEAIQLRLQNSFFDIYRIFRASEIEKLEMIHVSALRKMNAYNSDPTNFEKKLQVSETEKISRNRFIELFQLLLEDRALKATNHDISIYYDEVTKSLIIHITNNGETVYYNDYTCSKEIAKIIADSICEEFIENHKITLPSINESDSILTIQNTYFTIKRKFEESEKETIVQLKEKAHVKRESGQNEISQFQKKLEYIKKTSDR